MASVKKTPKNPIKAGTSKRSAEERKLAFVEAYLSNGGNATDAALQAGYSSGGAAKQGYRMSKDPTILSMIGQRQVALANKYELTTDAIIQSIAQEIHFDPACLYNEDGSLKSIHELDKNARMALASVEFEQHGSVDAPVFVRKVKWASRYQAREQAMKHLGMFERDNAQKSGALSGLPREMVQLIVERLRLLKGGK